MVVTKLVVIENATHVENLRRLTLYQLAGADFLSSENLCHFPFLSRKDTTLNWKFSSRFCMEYEIVCYKYLITHSVWLTCS